MSTETSMSEAQIAIDVVEFIHGERQLERAELRRWLRATDPDVLGAVYRAVSYHWGRIKPGFTRMQYARLLNRFVAATLVRPGKTVYAMTPSEVIRTYCGFLLECYRSSDEEAVKCMQFSVRALGGLYRRATPRMRRCIVDAGIEHLFEESGMRAHFDYWRRDRVLSRGYREALDWAQAQPPAPLAPATDQELRSVRGRKRR
jgi:hypothetical protein